MVQYDISQKAGHLAQEAGQTTLVDVQGQAVAKTQESHHTAPADAALKQAVGKGSEDHGEPTLGAFSFLLPLPPSPALGS